MAGVVHEEESRHLPTHVAACAERYITLFKSVERVDRRAGRLEKILIRAACWIIATQFGLIGTLAAVLWKMGVMS